MTGALILASLLMAAWPSRAADDTSTGDASTSALDLYAGPQRVMLPDGRGLHIVCLGHGAPTVILTAGVGDWSSIWSKVQPPLARRTRVCAWDRAGFGLSDPSPQPQTADTIARDLDALLAAAKIRGPYVLAAHSAGLYETLLFADRHRRDIGGLVLVDPSLPDMLNRLAVLSPKAAEAFRADLAARATRLRACSAGGGKDCFSYAPAYGARLIAALAALDQSPARLLTRASLYENFAASAQSARDPGRDYGDMPLLVLTSDHPPTGGLPVESPEKTAVLNSLWSQGHDELAALSRRGVNRLVAGTGHAIQTDRPEAVIAALNAILDAARR